MVDGVNSKANRSVNNLDFDGVAIENLWREPTEICFLVLCTCRKKLNPRFLLLVYGECFFRFSPQHF